jgi:excisionase family DNA binding protein
MSNRPEIPEGYSPNAWHHAQLLMGVSDAMKCLDVGRTKFYELVASGEIELVKIGTASRVVVPSIVAYVERLRVTAQGRAA